MKNIVNEHSETTYAPPRKGEIRHCVADISLAKTSFDFNPSTEMYANLKGYIEWMKSDSSSWINIAPTLNPPFCQKNDKKI